MSKLGTVGRVIRGTLFFILVTITSLMIGMCIWTSKTFNVSINAIVNTMLNNLQGTSQDTIRPAVLSGLPWALLAVLLIIFYVLLERKFWKQGRKNFSYLALATAVLYFCGGLLFVQSRYDFIGYFQNKNTETSLYADRYVDPRSVEIKAPEQKRNLVYIYLESMETTYADEANGGAQEVNYIPNLVKLAQENISFFQSDGFGGFQATEGASWTMGAIFTTTSGVPFRFPVGVNDMKDQEIFASGIYTLGDFLEDEGYHQMFLCGSNASFAGRRKYFKQHGDFSIYDYKKAIKKGDIPEDYKVWWGFEDAKLYEIAKKQLKKLAQKDEPFNFTMLTVDTHHIGGYVCDICTSEYENPTANVVACADKQIADFVKWLKDQDFYENTTVVITGDHPRMDNELVGGVAYNDRRIFNCYLNTVHDGETIKKQRPSAGIDVFPTTLSAMGYEIEGNRLGLGANLFSDEPTLVEEMGIEALNMEFNRSSKYYIDHFSPELSSD